MVVTTMHGAAREVSDPTFAAHFVIAVRINALVPMDASTFFLEVTTQIGFVNFKSIFLWSCQHCRDAYCHMCQYTAVKFNPPVGDFFMINFAGRKYSTLKFILSAAGGLVRMRADSDTDTSYKDGHVVRNANSLVTQARYVGPLQKVCHGLTNTLSQKTNKFALPFLGPLIPLTGTKILEFCLLTDGVAARNCRG